MNSSAFVTILCLAICCGTAGAKADEKSNGKNVSLAKGPSGQIVGTIDDIKGLSFSYPKCWNFKRTNSGTTEHPWLGAYITSTDRCPKKLSGDWKITLDRVGPRPTFPPSGNLQIVTLNGKKFDFHEFWTEGGGNQDKPKAGLYSWSTQQRCGSVYIEAHYFLNLDQPDVEKQLKKHKIPDFFKEFVANIQCSNPS